MQTISVSKMQVRETARGLGVMAMVDGEMQGVSRPGEDDLLDELPAIDEVVEVGTERMRVGA